MNAQQLFRDGVVAIRDHQNLEEAQTLLRESLKLDPDNIDAWLWLSKTTNDPAVQLRCVTRALAINPINLTALKLKEQLTKKVAQSNRRRQPKPKILSQDEERRVNDLLKSAARADKKGDTQAATRLWMDVLEIEVDHGEAMEHAVNALWKSGYYSDAKLLLQRAYDANTQTPLVYLTGIDILEREGRHREADELCWYAAQLPSINTQHLMVIVDRFSKANQTEPALKILERAIKRSPRDQDLLLKMGDFQSNIGNPSEARAYYDYAARLGTSSQAGKDADSRFKNQAANLSASERQSMLLALREAIGIGLFFLILAIQDAGLTFDMDSGHWMGVGLALVGGYLLITATSSPQQAPIASWLSFQKDDPRPLSDPKQNHPIHLALLEAQHIPTISSDVRMVIGFIGIILLLGAFKLVFSTSIDLAIDWYKTIGII